MWPQVGYVAMGPGIGRAPRVAANGGHDGGTGHRAHALCSCRQGTWSGAGHRAHAPSGRRPGRGELLVTHPRPDDAEIERVHLQRVQRPGILNPAIKDGGLHFGCVWGFNSTFLVIHRILFLQKYLSAMDWKKSKNTNTKPPNKRKR